MLDTSFLGKDRLLFLLYGQFGCGKSVSINTLLKIPKLKVRILILEDTARTAIRIGSGIHGIDKVEPGQLVVCTPKTGKIASVSDFEEKIDDTSYKNIIQSFFTFNGIDVANGKEVALGAVSSWDSDSVLVIDGLTMLQFACSARGIKKSRQATNGKANPQSEFFAGQDTLIGAVYQLIQTSKCHMVVMAHEAITITEEAKDKKTKALDLPTIHPALGTRSIVSSFCGRFQYVFYAKKLDLLPGIKTSPYVWSCVQKDTYVADRLDKNRLSDAKIDLDKMPADFSHPAYGFFE